MMLLERWAIALTLGVGLASTAGAPGQSAASPNTQAQDKDKANQDMDDAEPAEFHPPAEIGQPDAPPPPAPVAAGVESPPPVQVSQPVAAPPPLAPPDPPLSKDPVERQLQIDTAHLLQLAEELKAEVDKAGSDTLSLAALRKAEELQRLARTLKERMRDRAQVSQSKP